MFEQLCGLLISSSLFLEITLNKQNNNKATTKQHTSNTQATHNSPQHNPQMSVSLETSLNNWKTATTNTTDTNNNNNNNATTKQQLLFLIFWILRWDFGFWGEALDFEVRFWILRWDVGVWGWNLIWASTINVISRISSCDKRFARFWLTKTLQMSDNCMFVGAKVAKGGPLGRVV